ncbi:hypothetical protein BO82DRAFT_354359 [Aspergillus uvarum CBS 121591]|uniref:Apple domain-containing protein n=1 Tax=Aspergillus uvarum CBS 121591 TaxID=1448315 RepID=A0A319CS86_9EURO|nr:hypothetical protein BO82DRAFT_354359 [Aspergillus uvarum CBS 121591]PYH81613.1 hypothetical protein BO82DRAFT_354359 [Aspergillus uvarum CBS 121591]
MLFQATLFAALLGTTVASSGSNSKCLSSNTVGAANYQLCCPESQGSGKGTVGDSVFEFTCGQYLTGKSGAGTQHRQVNSAKDCAQLCSSPDCPGASWHSTGKKCFVLGSGNTDYAPYSPAKDWMVLTKSAETPEDPDPEEDCKEFIDAAKETAAAQCTSEKEQQKKECESNKASALTGAKAQCEAEKTQLKEQAATAASQCEADKTAALEQCTAEKEQIHGEEKAKCEAEKAELANGATASAEKCESDKAAALAGASQQCATEKEQLRQEGEAQCKSDKEAASSDCEKEKNEIRQQGDSKLQQCQADKDSAVANANAQCATEKDQLQSQSKSEKDAAASQCEKEKDEIRQQGDSKLQQCQADKDSAVANANAQCATEKDQLQKLVDDARLQCKSEKDAATSQCEKEKDEIRKQGENQLQQSKSQYEAEKAGLQQKIKELEDKTSSVGSGTAGGQWLSVDEKCRSNSWRSLCDGTCSQRQFTLGGVDFQVKCNVRTNGAVEEIWWYRQSILECAEACALNPRCLGVGWRNFGGEPEKGVCHAMIKWDHIYQLVNTAFPHSGGEHLIYAKGRITPTGAPGT